MRGLMNVTQRRPITHTYIKGFGLMIRYHGKKFYPVNYMRNNNTMGSYGLFRVSLLSLQFGDEDKIPVYALDTYSSSYPIRNRTRYHFCSVSSLIDAAFEASLGTTSIENMASDLDNVIEEKLCMLLLKQAVQTHVLLVKHSDELIRLKLQINEISRRDTPEAWKLQHANVYTCSNEIDLDPPDTSNQAIFVEPNGGGGHRVGIINLEEPHNPSDYFYDFSRYYATGSVRRSLDTDLYGRYHAYSTSTYNIPEDDD